jgi:hypothetical protein
MLSAMIPLIGSVDAWWTRHPHIAELILFFVALFASIFPERSRRWLMTPFYYSVLGVFRLTQRKAKNDLEIMRLIGDSTFNLVAYVGFYCISAIFTALRDAVIFAILGALVSYWVVGHPALSGPFFAAMVIGGLAGRATRLKWLFGYLLNREKSMARLEKMAAGERID